MNKFFLSLFVCLLFAVWQAKAQGLSEKDEWKAEWITCDAIQDTVNTWTAFRKSFTLQVKPTSAIATIAVDSKYWLWVNGKLAVFEGGAKRGPTPQDTYYDEVDLSQFLKEGKNTLAILVWYFGKSGFSHHSSGRSGLLFDLAIDGRTDISSDPSWRCISHPAYMQSAEGIQPNYRLSEPNIIYDAQKEPGEWTLPEFDETNWTKASVVGKGGCSPWNRLFKRPIPLWKDFGLKQFEKNYPFISMGDTIKCNLPYNAQVTPYLKIESDAGLKITMLTDNYKGGSAYNVRAEYTTKQGIQEYESLGWMNGHELWYIIPSGVKIVRLGYRETGYNTEFTGSFSCEDTFYNQLWEKSLRTLYITMRDTYMDCPDRERAQWWGDAVNEIGESFYALCPGSHLLAKKGIYELMNWQRSDSTIYSPVPGIYDKELPMQMLNSVGYYGFWTYFYNTGDTATIRDIYPNVKKYLSVWKIGEDGLVIPRKGGWTWGDWGDNKDLGVLYNTWYYLACKGYLLMSEMLAQPEEMQWAEQNMKSVKTNFDKVYWNGTAYRSPGYNGKTDDRANAMAVLSGLATPEKFPMIRETLINEEHASPYMEKYVLEALFSMGYHDEALLRLKKRFSKMVDSELTTLWEGWGIGKEGFGGGTYNHAWSGGGLTLLSQYVAGIEPAMAGFKIVKIQPRMGFLKQAQAEVHSVAGKIKVNNVFTSENTFEQTVESPSPVKLYMPVDVKKIRSVKIDRKVISLDAWNSLQEKGFIDLDKGKYKILVKINEN